MIMSYGIEYLKAKYTFAIWRGLVFVYFFITLV